MQLANRIQQLPGYAPGKPLITSAKPARHPDGLDLSCARYLELDPVTLQENRVLTGDEPAAYREAYALLRTQILQRFRERNWQTLAVTSTRAGAGRTLTAINLAISMAREISRTVVLVDANLRRPGMLNCLGVPERNGLGNYLVDGLPVSDLLVRSAQYPGLYLLPAGRLLERSAEWLNATRMDCLMRHLTAGCDDRMVIFDVPPVLQSADTLSFIPRVDATLLVVEDGVTVKHDLERAIDLLTCTNLVGTVLNKART